jgi:toxin ParE1/3/4
VRYTVERASDADRDLDEIFEFLIESYAKFGEDVGTAIDHAAERMQKIHDSMQSLGDVPHQGTLMPQILPGLRSVTKDRAIFYFTVDDGKRTLKVLAIFFGGQDHRRRMLKRLLGG